MRWGLARVNTEGMVSQSRPPILITRPQPQASRFARHLRSLDWTGRVLVSPVLEPVFLSVAPPGLTYQAVILTSETAVRAAQHLSGLPKLAFCVGDRTARLARRAGFLATSAKGDAADLLAVILQSGTPGPMLYLHGRETRGSLAQDLNKAGVETHATLAYAQDPRPLGAAVLRLIRKPGPVVLPVFSPRSAALLATQWQAADARSDACVVALSQAVAAAAAPLRPARIKIAAHPDGDSLLAAMKHMAEEAGWA